MTPSVASARCPLLWKRWAYAALALGLVACSPAANKDPKIALNPAEGPPAYDYPIQNPYVATIVGMPPEKKLDYSDMPEPSERTLTVFPNREIPEGFWYDRGLRYSRLIQDKPAPLVYVIAGTGADHRAEKMRTIGNTLYSAGFSVVLLPSPTHPNFIINASSNYLVGRPLQSAQDLYRVMKLIDADVAKDAKITAHMLMGYSLGGLDAAFTAKLDDEQHALNFSRVLLVNPPYNLFSSMKTISAMLYQDMPNGMDNADVFLGRVLQRLSTVGRSGGDALNFSNERALLEAYEKYKPDDAKLATLIGLSFQLSSASTAFTADVMSKTGYLFPKNREFMTDTDLTTSMALSLRTSYIDYFNEYYMKRLQAAYPNATKESLVAESNLAHLDGYIRGNPKFGLITNLDDVILAHGEVYKLADLFGKNAFLFSNGGHVGNLAHPTVGYDMVWFLKGGSAK